MDVEVKPAVGPAERRALVLALARSDVRPRGSDLYGGAWRHAGLREGVGDDEGSDALYALSPRKTRGATRA